MGGFQPHQPGFPPQQLPGALPQLHGAGPQAGFPPQLHGFPPHVAAQFHAHPDPPAVCPLLRVTRLRDAERDQQQLLYALMVHRQRQVTQCAAPVPVEVGRFLGQDASRQAAAWVAPALPVRLVQLGGVCHIHASKVSPVCAEKATDWPSSAPLQVMFMHDQAAAAGRATMAMPQHSAQAMQREAFEVRWQQLDTEWQQATAAEQQAWQQMRAEQVGAAGGNRPSEWHGVLM